ncbi:hypothetical protein Esti_001215 [Eimeria stiedai]
MKSKHGTRRIVSRHKTLALRVWGSGSGVRVSGVDFDPRVLERRASGMPRFKVYGNAWDWEEEAWAV